MQSEDDYDMSEIFDEEGLDKIDILSSQMMRNISNDFRKTRRASIDFGQEQQMNFQEALNLDMTIEKFLSALEKTKISLVEFSDLQMMEDCQSTHEFKTNFCKDLKKYQKTLMLREAQIGALVYLLENRKQQNFIESYLQKYGDLKDYIIQVEETGKPINIFVMEEAIQMEIEFLEEYKDMTDLLRLNIVHKKYVADMQGLIQVCNRLKIINSKIVTIAEIFPYACTLDKDDLFSFKKTHDRWRQLARRYIKHKSFGDSKSVRESFTKLKNGLNLVNATMSLLHQYKQHWSDKNWNKVWGITSKMMKCAFFQKDANRQAQVLISEPDSKLAKQIWNLPEEKMFRNIINSTLPAIQFCKQFWIPRVYPQFLQIARICKETPNIPQLQIQNPKAYCTEMFKQKQYEAAIPLRINSPFSIKLKFSDSPKTYGSMFMSMFKKASKASQYVILHIHGGGFISMSSFVHQTYTRVWANNLGVPIISVDYGKAPEHPFPEGLYDCFEAYMWILYQLRQIYDIEPFKIILVGDSAGGNLVAALTTLLISYKLKIPDGIVLVYPALNLNYKNYTPSLLTSLNDMILPHTFLKVCLQAYIKKGLDPKTDPFLSPIASDNDVLGKYPKTRIFVGSKDPFHDDCCRLTEKLNNLNPGICKLTIFEQFPHGFLQFDIKTQPHAHCRQATKEVEVALKQLLEIQ